jgi:hypothetical protein
MKLTYNILIAAFIFQSFCAFSQSDLSKVYDYQYTVANSSQVLSLDNRFGTMHIETTDGNQVIVTVTVTVVQRNEKRAEDVMSSISIKATESASLISVQSKVGSNINNKSGESFNIKFDVKMPKTMILEAKQSFGDLFVQDLIGKVDISVKYGNLKAESMTGTTNLEVEFGNGDVEYIKGGAVVVKYSKFNLQKGGKIDLTQGFSDITIGKVDDLTIESKYGSVEIESVSSIKGNSNFSGFRIGKLQKNITLVATYGGGVKIKNVAKDIAQMKLTGKFTSFEIDFEPGINANLDVTTEFCNFRYNETNTAFTSRIKDSNRGQYIGKIGKGGGLITIDSSYGDIRLNY